MLHIPDFASSIGHLVKTYPAYEPEIRIALVAAISWVRLIFFLNPYLSLVAILALDTRMCGQKAVKVVHRSW